MKRFLFWLTSRLPCRIIDEKGKPYLERYYLFTLLGTRFYIHRFVGSDPDRGLHDHPWPWAVSLLLSGFYLEERRGSELHQVKQPNEIHWFNFLLGDSFHRVVLPTVTVGPDAAGKVDMKLQHCWTLFFHRARNSKPWGFLRRLQDHGYLMWVPHNFPGDGSGTTHAWWETAPVGAICEKRQAL